jgi:hypothetical protein
MMEQGTAPRLCLHTADYLKKIGVREIAPSIRPFDPGYDPATLESHLDQSSHLISILKISMACWMVAKESTTRRKVIYMKIIERTGMHTCQALAYSAAAPFGERGDINLAAIDSVTDVNIMTAAESRRRFDNNDAHGMVEVQYEA